MSEALYDIGGLRFWTEREIMVREQAIQTLVHTVQGALLGLNSAWTFHRVEGPLLTPRKFISPAYDDSDIFLTQAKLGDQEGSLRAETTASSYLYAEKLLKSGVRPPACIWQAGKSFRRETNDGARASELRFNEFYQLEFQCIYASNTKADYRAVIEPAVGRAIAQITRSTGGYRIIPSDRLPEYSLMTNDVEVEYGGKMKEMCSISTRKDFPIDNMLVLEVAIGLDRLVVVESEAE